MKLRNTLISVAGVLLTAASGFAQIISIVGDATGPDGSPLANACCVMIDRTDIRGHYQARTDGNGHYSHYGLPIGTYKVSFVDGSGNVLASADNVRTRDGAPTVVNLVARHGVSVPSTSGQPVTGAPAAPLPAGSPQGTTNFSGSYYARTSASSVEKWDFKADGAFVHEGAIQGGASVRKSEKGTFVISGDTLKLTITEGIVGYLTPGSRGSILGGGRNDKASTRESRIQLLGARGENGVVIDGVKFDVRHGW